MLFEYVLWSLNWFNQKEKLHKFKKDLHLLDKIFLDFQTTLDYNWKTIYIEFYKIIEYFKENLVIVSRGYDKWKKMFAKFPMLEEPIGSLNIIAQKKISQLSIMRPQEFFIKFLYIQIDDNKFIFIIRKEDLNDLFELSISFLENYLKEKKYWLFK